MANRVRPSWTLAVAYRQQYSLRAATLHFEFWAPREKVHLYTHFAPTGQQQMPPFGLSWAAGGLGAGDSKQASSSQWSGRLRSSSNRRALATSSPPRL